MNNSPLVSILINNYNYERFLPEAINSALNQTYSNTEVIVVDDGSTDNSQEVIESYGNKIIAVLKDNGGQSSAFNAGFAASQGDIICFLDSDDIFLPEKVAEIVDVLRGKQELGWCFHPLKLVDTNLKIFAEKSYDGSSEYDLRARIKRGKGGNPLPFAIPATSGICCTRSLLELIFPMPVAEGITLNDSYLKFAALWLSKGFALSKELTLQRIHDNNAFTLKHDPREIAKIQVFMAYWMRVNFPELYKFTNNIFAEGISAYWRTGGIDQACNNIVKSYLSSATLIEKFWINFKGFYYYLRPK